MFFYKTTGESCVKIIIFVCGSAKPFLANRNAKYELHHCIFQIFHIFAGSGYSEINIHISEKITRIYSDRERPVSEMQADQVSEHYL